METSRRSVLAALGAAGVPAIGGRAAAIDRRPRAATPFDLAWLRRHSRNRIDAVSAVTSLAGGGYAFVGHTVHAISEDVWVVRATEVGWPAWNRALLRSATARVFDVVEDLSGDLVVTGWYRTDGTESDVLFLRIAGDGDPVVEETYGIGRRDAAFAVVPVRPGNYALLGYTQAGGGSVDALAWIARPDGPPVTGTTHAFDGEATVFADGVRTPDGGCLAVGRWAADGDQDALVAELDPRGRRRWWRTIDLGGDAWASAVVRHPDGGYVVGGNGAGGDASAWLVRVADDGTERWRTRVGGADARLRALTTVGSDILVGGLQPAGEDSAWVGAVGPSGDPRWSSTFGRTDPASVAAMTSTADGGAVAAGSTLLGRDGQDGYLAKLVPDGRDPVPAVAVDPWSPAPGERVTLDGSGSRAPDGEIVRYEWDLDGDGTADARGRVIEHTFREPGEHAVTLRVVDDAGRTGTTTFTVSVGTPATGSTPADDSAGVPGFGVATAVAGLAGATVARLLGERE